MLMGDLFNKKEEIDYDAVKRDAIKGYPNAKSVEEALILGITALQRLAKERLRNADASQQMARRLELRVEDLEAQIKELVNK